MHELQEIRKLSNRRLFDPLVHRYVTLFDINSRIATGIELLVTDVRNEDVTRVILFQVMAAQEQRADPSLSEGFLLQAIRHHAELSGGLAAMFLEQSLKLLDSPPRERTTVRVIAAATQAKMARRLAKRNFELWCGALKRICEIVASAETTSCPPQGVCADNTESVIPVQRLTRESRRPPRAPAVTARR
jgi:polyhydroxyalkanoate synthesis repressor PhaR